MAQLTITSTNDNAAGRLDHQSNNFSTARDAAVGTSASAADTLNGCFAYLTSPGGTYFISRGVTTYNLASVPSQSKINSVTIQLYISSTSFANEDSDTMYIVESSQSSSLVTSDYNNVTFTELGSKALSAITQNAYNDFELNATGIALVQTKTESVLKLGHLMGKDFNNVAPTGNNQVNIAGSSGDNPPKVVVTYTPFTGSFLFGFV